ncbi:MAG: cell division protein SepF [Acidimicrobiales bacterium]
MAASFMKKTMAYLGLVDDDYDDYDYDEPRGPAMVGRAPQRSMRSDDRDEIPPVAAPSRIRTLPMEEAGGPVPVAQQPLMASRTSSIRPMTAEAAGAKVHVVAPNRFADAQEIANRLMGNQPVIVNLQNGDRDLQRRMIDFCSGVTYALAGGMERVADEVFLLTPSNVKVSDEERRRLTERGLVNP